MIAKIHCVQLLAKGIAVRKDVVHHEQTVWSIKLSIIHFTN